MKTAQQPTGELATNPNPAPIIDRRKISYHEKQGRSLIDKLVLVVVGVLAITIIALSFQNTAALAKVLKLNPKLAACLVEMLFGSLLFIRARQRALRRNVPLFLDIGYFTSLAFVTVVNMWGLGQIHATGYVFGAAITGAMWLMESTLVWLWTDSHRPHEKTVKELRKEVKKEIEKIKGLQWMEWEKSEAQNPDPALIKKAREAEQKRKQIVGEGLPEFFRNKKYELPNTKQTAQDDHRTSNTDTQTSEGQTNKQTGYDQTNEQDQLEQTAQTKQDESKQTEATEQKDNKQTPDEHRTNKDEANTKQEPIDEQTDDQTNNAQKDTEQTNNEQTNKVIYINNKQTRQTQTNTSNKQEKQTNNEQQAEQADKQTQRKHASTKQTRRTVKQTANVPTYEQLLEMIDQTFEANKKLPTVRGFAEQANIKPNRAHTALRMWKESNGQTAANN